MAITEQSSKRRRQREHIDRLSALPDSILCHILSFLLTKDSVRTSILGKRWRYLWAYVPTLDFELENIDFISRVMSLHKMQTITTFRLFRSEDEDYSPKYKKWVTAAINRSVQNLDLFCPREMILPRCLFTCKTLVYLRLDDCSVSPPKCAVYLPRLKKLHLTCVLFEANESLPHLLSGCPVLEELLIQPPKPWLDVVPYNVFSPTVKRLTVDCGVGGDESNMLELNTPALNYVKIIEFFYANIKSGVMTSLIEADIILFKHYEGEEDSIYSQSLVEFIARLCNVKYLNLVLYEFHGIIDFVLSAWSSTISFHNLTKLELTADCRFLPKFLECADNLQILIFSEYHLDEKAEIWTEPPQVPKCLLSHLRIIKLVAIEGKKHEFEYIRYFLRNALVLERMEIACSRFLGLEKSFSMLQEISLLRRGSNACEVAFVRR